MNFKQWLILSETITIKDQEFRDPLNALKHIQATHPNPENLVVTFTAIDKVGINPKSKYDTPLGIYFYPLDYVIHKEMDVEFAGNQPYINVCEFTRPDKILHMTDDVNNQKGLELLNVFPQEEVDVAMQNISNNYMYNYMLRSDYSELWLVTREIAGKRAIDVFFYGVQEKTNEAVLWNTNLRKCGIDGFLDHGTGTIHRNEPTQGVVFTANSLKRILVIPQRLFTKQGESMPVRKPLPDLNRIPLNQIENLLKTRNLSDNDFHYLLAFAPDKDEMAKLIVQHVKELSGDNINSLLGVVSDKQEMARLIAQHVTELNNDNVYTLLNYVSDKEEMLKILGPENINKLTDNNVSKLIAGTDYNPRYRQEMINFIIKYKTELSDANVYYLLSYASDKEKIAEILGSDNINKLTNDNVTLLLGLASDKVEMAEILGSDNINKITGDRIYVLLNTADDKEKIAEILGPDNINKLNDDNVYDLLKNSIDKEKMAEILGPNNINKLDGDNVYRLLYNTTDREKMAEILGKNNIDKLTGQSVSALLASVSDKEKMAEILGSENINKLDGENVKHVLYYARDKKEMAEILRKYYTGKDTNIISLLNQ